MTKRLKHEGSATIIDIAAAQASVAEKRLKLDPDTYRVCEPVWPSGKALGW